MKKRSTIPEKTKTLQTPHGIVRRLFRLPIWLYRARMGWAFGHRFVLLTHTGRRSGLARQTVLEIVRYDDVSGACVVASGWDERSDWVRNVTDNPNIIIQVNNRRTQAVASRLPLEQGSRELADYARRHPAALRELAAFMGYRLDGTSEDILALGRIIPMFIFEPDPKIT